MYLVFCRILAWLALLTRSRTSLTGAGNPVRPGHSILIIRGERTATSWSAFLRSQSEAIIALDFFEAVTLTGTRLYVLAAIERANRRVRVLGATAQPTAVWVAQAARNLVMDIDDAGCKVKYLIRDRDGKYLEAFDTVLSDAEITVVLSVVRVPHMNSIMERWIQSCRHELLDRTLVWNQAHLLHVLREYEIFLIHTGSIEVSRTPGHSHRCPNRSPIRAKSWP